MRTESIGQILIRQSQLTTEQLDRVLRLQQTRRPHVEIGELLIDQGLMTAEQLGRALAEQWDIEYLAQIEEDQLAPEYVHRMSLAFLKRHHIVPVRGEKDTLLIAVSDPLNVIGYDAVAKVVGGNYPRVLCSVAEIEQAISRCYYHGWEQHKHEDVVDQTIRDSSEPSLAATARHEDLMDIANQAPIVKLVNTILFRAVQHRASDIHIEPYEHEVKVRFRVDGVLQDALTPSKGQLAGIISRLKIMSNLNIAERRLPQDGQSRIKIGDKELDIRVSIIPTSGGERVVLRLLDKGGAGLSMEQLGFSSAVKKQFTDLIHMPHGILLLTGPTGSGKTTTLYCAINELNNHERNILTVEDPIEYQLPGVGQMQVKPKIDLTFANCLRHILRQDPDVIMIGEIRDRETAEIAVHASLTGHMVLSTLHTNDSASAVSRLIDMHVEPYLICSSLKAVMAQRLLRVICPQCKSPCRVERDMETLLAQSGKTFITGETYYTGTGCSECLETGYLGRTGIFELLVIDEQIKQLIVDRAPAHQIKAAALAQGMMTLREDGLARVRAGMTTVEEVLRCTQDVGESHMAKEMEVDASE